MVATWTCAAGHPVDQQVTFCGICGRSRQGATTSPARLRAWVRRRRRAVAVASTAVCAVLAVVIIGKINAAQDSYDPVDRSGFDCPYLLSAVQAGDLNAQRTYEELCE